MRKVTHLTKLSDAATQGIWEYRPNRYDDWGTIRGPKKDTPIGRVGPIAMVGRRGDDETSFDTHRENDTDPYSPNSLFVVELVNAFRAGKLVEVDQ